MPRTDPPRRSGGAPAGRDRFLDTLRTLALVRVTLWHAFGAPVLTYVVAAVPAMFFVTGSLLAGSLDRRPWHRVVLDRARRVLVPLWVFGAAAFAAMTVAWHIDPGPRTQVPWRSVVFWVLPLGDPQGSAWEGGWLSQPLWYVRTMFWLLLASPVLRALHRRLGLRLIVLPASALLVLEVLARRNVVIGAAPELLWQLGDVALASIFLLAGFAHRDGRFDRLGASGWLRGAAVAAVASVAWIATQPVPLGVVNNSHPAHLFVGAAWLCLLFAARGPVVRFGTIPQVRVAVDWIAQRTMSVYLWHSTGIIVTYQLLARVPRLPFALYVPAMIGGMAAVTACLVLATGWVEDLAARRPVRWWPQVAPAAPRVPQAMSAPARPRVRIAAVPALAGAVVLALAATTARPATQGVERSQVAASSVASTSGNRRPPVPSQAPPRPSFTAGPAAAPAAARVAVETVAANRLPGVLAPDVDATTAAVLQEVLDAWRVRWSVPGVTAGVLLSGTGAWYGASGRDELTGRATRADDTFDIGSITKTFTGALVFQLADEGRIDLDAPVPPLDRVPAFPTGAGITVRHLLEHRSGLVPYRDVPGFATDAATLADPAAVLAAALRLPLEFAPGSRSRYSSTNYLVLGFLVEQVTGQRYDDLLTERLLQPLGLARVDHSPPGPLAPNFATGGIVTDAPTLLRWAVGLYRDGLVVRPDALAAMDRIDPVSGLGPSVYGYCPCTVDADGTARWGWIGHSGGTTQLAYSDADDVGVVINVTDSLWLDDRGRAIAELQELLRTRVLELVAPPVLPAFPAADDAPGGADGSGTVALPPTGGTGDEDEDAHDTAVDHAEGEDGAGDHSAGEDTTVADGGPAPAGDPGPAGTDGPADPPAPQPGGAPAAGPAAVRDDVLAV
jgi:CubicO group peptidase (beta-lactamase class C family)